MADQIIAELRDCGVPVIPGETRWASFDGKPVLKGIAINFDGDDVQRAKIRNASQASIRAKTSGPHEDATCRDNGCEICGTHFVVFVPRGIPQQSNERIGCGYSIFFCDGQVIAFQRVAFFKIYQSPFGAVRALAQTRQGKWLLVPRRLLAGWNEPYFTEAELTELEAAEAAAVAAAEAETQPVEASTSQEDTQPIADADIHFPEDKEAESIRSTRLCQPETLTSAQAIAISMGLEPEAATGVIPRPDKPRAPLQTKRELRTRKPSRKKTLIGMAAVSAPKNN